MTMLLSNKKCVLHYTFCLAIIVSLVCPGVLFGQSDSTAKQQPAQEEKQVTTYLPLIEFLSIQRNDNSVDFKASLKAKINGTLTKLQGLKVEFFCSSDSLQKKLGETVTDRNGVAYFNSKGDQLIMNKEGKLNFKVVFAGKDSLESAEEILAVKRARLEITPVKEDSLLTVHLKLVDISTGTETAIPETDLGVFVKRMFSALKLGEGKTDENGEITLEIPIDLPGDAKGNITLLAKLEDNEIFGNLEAVVIQKWGVPVSDEIKELPRALWSTHPPIWMLVTFIIVMSVVWGHYIVIIFQLFRLRKEEPKTSTSN